MAPHEYRAVSCNSRRLRWLEGPHPMTLESLILAGDLTGVRGCLRSGVDVDARSAEGLTALMIASGLGHFHLCELLLTAGGDVHAIEPRMGAAALHKAAQAGNPDVVGLLLDHGAFIDQQTPILGNTPLIDAVLYKQEAAVERLLEGGARTHITNHWQQTALGIARGDGLDAIAARIELHDTATAEQAANCTLVAAARAGDIGEVARRIAAGHPLDEQTPMAGSSDDNYTPLGIAAREGHLKVVRVLLEAGADPRRLIGLMGGMALHDATYFGHVEVVRLLTAIDAHGPRPPLGLDLQGAYNGLSALHDAVWHGHREVAQALVDAGARLDLKSHTGNTPRDLALLYGYPEIADLLARAEESRTGEAENKLPGEVRA